MRRQRMRPHKVAVRLRAWRHHSQRPAGIRLDLEASLQTADQTVLRVRVCQQLVRRQLMLQHRIARLRAVRQHPRPADIRQDLEDSSQTAKRTVPEVRVCLQLVSRQRTRPRRIAVRLRAQRQQPDIRLDLEDSLQTAKQTVLEARVRHRAIMMTYKVARLSVLRLYHPHPRQRDTHQEVVAFSQAEERAPQRVRTVLAQRQRHLRLVHHQRKQSPATVACRASPPLSG
mmetsp:Transcript_17269/g.27998  ORF Transcript_17269/g.27998 Transcript_17269/m.27998 type:complete len:229 (-) Transcript_17269:120-806(-)